LLSALKPGPVLQQLKLVDRRPLKNHWGSPARKFAIQYKDRLDSNLYLLLTIRNMKVGRIVIVVIHSDYDPEKPADLGHCPILTLPDANCLTVAVIPKPHWLKKLPISMGKPRNWADNGRTIRFRKRL
jgi:hypothetical protein